MEKNKEVMQEGEIVPAGTVSDPRLVLRGQAVGAADHLHAKGLSPLIAKLFAQRGIVDSADIVMDISELRAPEELKNCLEMANLLTVCREEKKRVLIISDYDCDGATACAVLLKAFQASGMNTGFLVPNREIHGYGLTPEIVNEAANLRPKPDYIITVDAGISSNAGVHRANELGIKVLITDHHLAPAVLPEAELIVNPNQVGDSFPSKHIAGCGVAWYVAAAYFEALEAKGIDAGFVPEELLPFVALGTIADVVSLDRNNRILVSVGLDRIRAGDCSYGIKALASVGKRNIPLGQITTQDFGFSLGPRVNAAGRLNSMETGIECLTTDNKDRALELAQVLDETNEKRKEIQAVMVLEAEKLKNPEVAAGAAFSISVFNASFHKGVVGIVAGRMKELYYRPTFVLTSTSTGEFVGSGRSIPGFHLKHALDEMNIDSPGLLVKFGGHAMAAGVTIAAGRLEEFKSGLEAVCKKHLTPELLEIKLEHDGNFPNESLDEASILEMHSQVWGQGFPYPVFVDEVNIIEASQLSEGMHLKLKGKLNEKQVDLISFFNGHRYPDIQTKIKVAHQPGINSYSGKNTIQLQISSFPGLPALSLERLEKMKAEITIEADKKYEEKKKKAIILAHATHQKQANFARILEKSNTSEMLTTPKVGGMLDRMKRLRTVSENGCSEPVYKIQIGEPTEPLKEKIGVTVSNRESLMIVQRPPSKKTVEIQAPPMRGGLQDRLNSLRESIPEDDDDPHQKIKMRP